MPNSSSGSRKVLDRKMAMAIKEFVAMENEVVDLLLECFDGRKDIVKRSAMLLANITRSKHYPTIRKAFPDIIKSYLIGITTALIYDANPDIQLEIGEELIGESLALAFESIDFESIF